MVILFWFLFLEHGNFRIKWFKFVDKFWNKFGKNSEEEGQRGFVTAVKLKKSLF